MRVRVPSDELLFILGRDNIYYIVVLDDFSGKPVDIKTIAKVETTARIPGTNITIQGDTFMFTHLDNTVLKVVFPKDRVPPEVKPGHVLFMTCDVTTTYGFKHSILQPPQRIRVVSPD